VITNLDREHLEAYADFDDLRASFVRFANSVSNNGAVVLCLDDPHLRDLVPEIKRHVVTYGLQEGADVTASNVRLEGYGSLSSVRGRKPGGRVVEFGELKLSVPGRHNVQNALAAVAMGRELGIGWSDISQALAGFHGVERRFQRHGDAGGVTVVEDYGHHPTEIEAVIAAAKPLAGRRLIVAFQPHRFSRTRLLFDDFARCFAGADVLVLTDIYAAGEEPIPGVGIDTLQARIARDFTGEMHVVKPLADLPAALASIARAGDLVLLLGAGSIGSAAPRVLDALKEQG
jgi:UDP-N-acetylmuramate--alanine ligase